MAVLIILKGSNSTRANTILQIEEIKKDPKEFSLVWPNDFNKKRLFRTIVNKHDK